MADRIAVMYLGVVVESGPAWRIMHEPLHPYTQALLSAAPTLLARRDHSWQRITLSGDLPNPAEAPSGCRFHPRCPLAREQCKAQVPPLRAVEHADHEVACHFAPETRRRGIEVGMRRLGVAPA
jgi:oligopeptide/dipeptide ABC transporter ATP-binding protein